MRRASRVVSLALVAGATFALSLAMGALGPLPKEVPCEGQPKLYANGRIQHCILSKNATISGVALPSGSKVYFAESGELDKCRLGCDFPFYGLTLPTSTMVYFTKDGAMKYFLLPVDTLIQGHMVKSTEGGVGNSLYPSGKLRAIWLAHDEVIDGVPCTSSSSILKMGMDAAHSGALRMVWFYENGRLQQAMLSRNVTVQGNALKQSYVVYFDPDGKLDFKAEKLK